jgi:hypothetical protein
VKRPLLALSMVAFICSSAFANDCVVRPIQVKAMCGKVVDLFNGMTIADVQVQLLSEKGETVASSKSDPNGGFSFFDIDKGNYILVFTADKWPPLRWPIQLSESIAKSCRNPFYVSLWNKDPQDKCASKVTKKKPWPVNDHL